jgi:hypothetical protein
MRTAHGLLFFGACSIAALACGNNDATPQGGSAGSAGAGIAGGSSSTGGDAASDAGSAGALAQAENAGAAGSVETPAVCTPASAQSSPPLIDDFEDDDNLLLQPSNRHGYWYANNDGTGTQVPKADPSGASFTLDAPGSPSSVKHAMHTAGSGFTSWGAFVSTNLNVQTNLLCPYDVSSFSGIRFNAKGAGALRVELGTRVTTPVADGGQCAAEQCSDYGLDVTLSSDWSQVNIPFADVELPTWASPAPWQPTDVVRLSFWVVQGDFDFWIDDVTFY